MKKKSIQIGGLMLLILASILAVVGYASQRVQAANSVAAPTAKTWYFAEGRVGSGFRQWLTVENPGSSACDVDVDYYYTIDGSTTGNQKTVKFTVDPLTRHTQNVNVDVPSPATLSAKVYVDSSTPTCNGVIAERPMYFNDFHSVSSGTDVIGLTDSQLTTHYYFADVPTHSAANSFISVLNPGDVTANVTASYYYAGAIVKTETISVAPKSRGTFQPGNDDLQPHVAALVTSDRPVMVERPSYFTDSYSVNGSADLTGSTATNAHWMFADGLTSSGSQTNLALANFGDTNATATINLRGIDGVLQTYTAKVAAKSQVIWDVNAHNSGTSEVSIDVSSDKDTLVAQRQIFSASTANGFSYQGVTDVMGVPNTGSKSLSYAEGFTSIGFDQQLALYNPNDQDATVNITLVNMLSRTTTQTVTVKAGSRATVNITQMVKDHLVQAGDGASAYAISMAVNSDQSVVAERVMHWNAFSTQGSTDVTGYAGSVLPQ